MTTFAMTKGERTVKQLARRLYGVRAKDEVDRAEEALAEANPLLAELRELPEGILVEVPDVEGLEPEPETAPLPLAAGATAIESARAELGDFRAAMLAAARGQVERAEERLEELDSDEVKQAAEKEPLVAERLESIRAAEELRLAEARALRSEQPRALSELQQDLADLGELFGTP